MAKAASSTTTKRATTTKSSASEAKPRARTQKAPAPPLPSVERSGSVVDLTVVTDRLAALEENLTQSVSSLVAEIKAVKPTPPLAGTDEQAPSETFLPIVADLIRSSLTEQLTPIIASLKRLEERVGFIGNRLKHPGSGHEQRQKPWRHDQPRHDQPRHKHPRGPNGPRPGPSPQWTPPSAASVQGHFAPRSFHGVATDHPTEEDDQ